MRPIQEVVVLVLKCALAIAAVIAIYCLAVVLMIAFLIDFYIGEVTGVKVELLRVLRLSASA